MKPLPIPELPDELARPVRSLLWAAALFRGAFVELAAGRPRTVVLAQRHELLLLAERVIDRWSSQLGREAPEDE